MTVYVVAEAGVNHNGVLQTAKTMVDVADEAGCDAIKFQTYRAKALTLDDASATEYQRENTGKTNQRELLEQYQFTRDQFRELHSYCDHRDVDFLSSPFDRESLDFLVDEFDLDTIKVPSGEITNGPLLYEVGRRRRRILLSTGMSTLEEIQDALRVLAHGARNESMDSAGQGEIDEGDRSFLRDHLTLLQCTSAYPTPEEEVHLRCLSTLRDRFNTAVGFSDHTFNVHTPALAVARGAQVVEKHFTLDRDQSGPDHSASLEPSELEEMVRLIRRTETMLGNDHKEPTPTESKNRESVRKGLYASRSISSGENFTREDLVSKRPATGLSPMRFWDLLGEPASRSYGQGDPIRE